MNPQLYNIVTRCLVHRCNKKCLDEHNQCKRRYPREFNTETTCADDGYPIYYRPDDGRTAVVGCGNLRMEITNQHIVPYNPWLTYKYDAHINVEICSTVKAVKYLYKYIYKGHDRIMVNAADHDFNEVQQYLDARYVSAQEACWRLLSFGMHTNEPNIYRLSVHLPNEETVVLKATVPLQNVTQPQTTLKAWMDINAAISPPHMPPYTQETIDHARTLTYAQMAEVRTVFHALRDYDTILVKTNTGTCSL